MDQHQQRRIPPVYQNKFFSTRRVVKNKPAAKPQSRGVGSSQLPQTGKVDFAIASTEKP
jgi:hypothetical protein